MYYLNQKSKNSIAFMIVAIFWLFLFISVFGLQGCSQKQVTSAQQVTSMMDIYNAQFTDYMYMTGYAKNSEGKWEKITEVYLTDDQKKLLKRKKEILTEVYPLISTYDKVVKSGGVTDPAAEAEIMRLLNKLTTVALE